MKKTYLQPESKTRAMVCATDLAGVSGQVDGDTIIGGGDEGGDPGGALGKSNNLWDDEEEQDNDRHMKRIFLILLLILSAVGMKAQTASVTITLRNGQIVQYAGEQYDSVRVLRNLTLNQADNVGVKVYLTGGKSADYIATKVEINSGILDDNINRNRYSRNNHGTWMLEMPRLSTDSINNLFLQKSTTQYGVTYSIEWDCAKLAQRWTAYQFHAGIPDNNVGRSTSNFHDDPELPVAYRTHDEDYNGSGFSRGHMCMSDDRQASEEQNYQTFYCSNIHPQYQNHNGVLWLKLENTVKAWGENRAFCDTLYVVKAGTIDKSADILGYTNSTKTDAHLIIPKYFYMCVLAVKGGQYKAIGFWTEHTNQSIKNANPAHYAKSIDEIEQLTGIDFFCNLPDETEEQVERSYTLSSWGLSN